MPPLGHFRFIDIDIPNSPNAASAGINNAGLVVGNYDDADYRKTHGFVWQKGVAQTLDYPGAAATYLAGINNRGVVIGYYDDASSIRHAVTYSLTSSTWTVLPKIPRYPATYGTGINDEGTAVGQADGYPFGHLAWIWHPDSRAYSYFDAPGAAEGGTDPWGVNADGKVVGNLTTEEQLGERRYGFVKDHDEYKDISVPGAVWTMPNGINKNATVAGYILTSTNGYFGFVRTSGGVFTMVNYPGSTWTHVHGINDHGAICGYWYNPASSHIQGFVAYPR